MESWEQSTHYAGLDWASDHHDVVAVDRQGQIVRQFRIAHTAEGWQELAARLRELGTVAVAVETNQGFALEQLLAQGLIVYPVNPKSAQRYRERKAPSGVKNDQLDAWSLADALRLDGHAWKALASEDPLVAELRLLTRDEVALIAQRTALVNQLMAALRDYYPAALEAFDDWTLPSAWAFLERFPTPQALVKAGQRAWEKFLHTHRLYRPETYPRRLEIFARADQFTGSAALTSARSLLATTLAAMLRTLEAQLKLYRQRIEALFGQHPDHDLFGSLPGAAAKLAPRLLAELGSDRSRFESAESLQCYAGTAPLTIQSGQMIKRLIRHACQHALRATVHLWANASRSACAWAQAYYQAHRDKGQSHACALRCLGQRWLKILWKMWQTKTPYDAELHAMNQQKHGSWVLKLAPANAAKTV
ncbi:MAG TPA: IS110 family transposase [Candidatus Acidoferrales bacterium]|nr:IS110 family transposase [Candidatus Acidoferrales bacterium]